MPVMIDPKYLMSMSATARRLGVSTSLVRVLADSGRLECYRSPLGRLIVAESVEQLAQERAAQKTVGRAGE